MDSGEWIEFPFRENLSKRNWDAISSVLGEGAQHLKSASNRDKLSQQTITTVVEVLHSILPELGDKDSISLINSLLECYRFLRNASCNQKRIQDIIGASTAFDDTVDILNILSSIESVENNQMSCIQVAIQFLGNAIVENENNQKIVWNKFYSLLMKLISSDQINIANCACMVVYNVLLGNSDVKFSDVSDIVSLLNCQARGSEFATFTVELVLAQEGMLETVYQGLLSTDSRLLILDAVWVTLTGDANRSEDRCPVHLGGIKFLASEAKDRANRILNVLAEGQGAEPAESLRLLEVLAAASSRTPYQPALQEDASLLISCACLLKSATDLGKLDNNVFTCVQRLADMRPGSLEAQCHPAFGFKVSLVRLVANLCYQHKYNQDQVRDLGCLPAVLDACNLDVHNPLLLQWGVLAVRNLLESNAANQQAIAGLIAQGPAPNAVLRELGVVLEESEDGQLCIAPLRRN